MDFDVSFSGHIRPTSRIISELFFIKTKKRILNLTKVSICLLTLLAVLMLDE